MIQIPITGVFATFDALHLTALNALLFAAETLVNYQPYVNINFL